MSSEVKPVNGGTKVLTDVMVQPEDNGKPVTCQVTHPATKEPKSVTQRLTILCKLVFIKNITKIIIKKFDLKCC